MRKATKWRKPTKFKNIRKWQPNVWLPEYEMIVADSCKGKSNTDLASQYNFTPEHISNILNTEEARNIKQLVVTSIRNKSLELMETQTAEIISKSVENIHKVLHDEALKETKEGKLQIFDRSVIALKGFNKLQDDAKAGHVTNIQNNMIITGKEETEIVKGLKDVAEIARLYAGMTSDSIK